MSGRGGQDGLIRARSGGCDPALLAEWVAGCGFDAASYLDCNEDLRAAGYDVPGALAHFLTHGYDEARQFTAGLVGDGLAAVTPPDAAYRRRLVRSLYLGQLRHPGSPARLWAGIDPGLPDLLRRQGGLPYVVIGDSHTNHYIQHAIEGETWLAALPLLCRGASARALGWAGSREPFGLRIMRWAASARGLDVPVFLKFGGIDAEFLWIRARLRAGATDFPQDAYRDYAAEAVRRYGQFIDALGGTIGFGRLMVCAVFPTVLTDDAWAGAFGEAFGPEMAALAAGVAVPNMRARTLMRAAFNTALRAMCAARGLRFVDDFTPLLDEAGVLDVRFRQGTGAAARHVDHAASASVMSAVIWGALGGS